MNCMNCGNAVPGGNKFCPSCGVPVDAEKAEQKPPSVTSNDQGLDWERLARDNDHVLLVGMATSLISIATSLNQIKSMINDRLLEDTKQIDNQFDALRSLLLPKFHDPYNDRGSPRDTIYDLLETIAVNAKQLSSGRR